MGDTTGDSRAPSVDGATVLVSGLVGRAPELAAVVAVLAAALRSPHQQDGPAPRLALVEGMAGVGKSRLLAAAIEETTRGRPDRRHQVLVASCPPVPVPYTLGAIVEAVRGAQPDVAGLGLSPLAGALRPLFPEWSAVLPPDLGPAEDAGAARHRLFGALAELLAALDVRVLVVEDAHWADEATTELLLHLATLPQAPFALVVTMRADEVPERSLLRRLSRLGVEPSGVRLTLAPFDVAETAALVSSMLGGDQVTAAFAEFLHANTDGLPLAIQESLRLMTDRADVARREGRWIRRHLDQIPLPPTLRDVVLARVERLGDPARTVLQAAAVLARPTGERALLDVTGLEPETARAGLVEALTSGLLVEESDGSTAFRHGLAARAVEEATPGPTQRRLHARAADALLRYAHQPPASLLARHARAAGRIEDWLRYGEEAADTALETGDEATAVDVLHDLVASRALAPADVLRLTAKFPIASCDRPALCQDLVDVLREIAARPELDEPTRAQVRYRLGCHLTVVFDLEAGRAELLAAIPGLAHDPAAAAKAMTLLGWPYGAGWSANTHADWLRRAAQLDPDLSEHDRLVLAVDRATALLMLGEDDGWTAAGQIPAESATAGDQVHLTRANFNIGDQALVWGRYDEAESRLDAARTSARTYDFTRLGDLVEACRLRLDWQVGRWSGLVDRAEVVAADEDLPMPTRLEATQVLGLLDAAHGRPGPARERLTAALDGWRRYGAAQLVPEAAATLGRLALADDAVDLAVSVTEEPIELVARKGIWLWAAEVLPARVEALCRAGRADEAGAVAAAFAAGVSGRDAPIARATVTVCSGLLARQRGDLLLAGAAFADAARAWRDLPRPYDAARADEARGRLILDSGTPDEGIAMLTAAFTAYTDLGADADVDRLRTLLRGLGADPRPRGWHGGRHGYGDRLSPREREVVALVIQGMTNQQVASALSRSPHTVSTQLRSAMRKLGVATRAALATKVSQSRILHERNDD